jgi:hypothetical protein
MATVADLVSSLQTLSTSYSDTEAIATLIGFLKARWEIPVCIVGPYLAMVYLTRNGIPAHPLGGPVDALFCLWNFAISLFSAWGTWNLGSAVFTGLTQKGLHYTICSDTNSIISLSEGRPAMLALSLFCLSKIPELLDTVFLILKRKQVRFLQWYHHAATLLFCWLALATEYTPGICFAITNYFVHSIMYMYFCLMTFKVMQPMLKVIAPFITIIQIAQMFWGLIVNAIAVGSYFSGGSCQIKAVTVYPCVVMFASYAWLFSKLYFDAKKPKGKKGKAEGVVRSISRAISVAVLDDENNVDEDEGAEASKGSKKVN